MSSRRLVRRTEDRLIAGVAAGTADYFDIDPTVVRLIFVALIFFGGTGLWLYLIMWVLVPTPDQITAAPRDVAKANVDDLAGEARRAVDGVRGAFRGDRDQPR